MRPNVILKYILSLGFITPVFAPIVFAEDEVEEIIITPSSAGQLTDAPRAVSNNMPETNSEQLTNNQKLDRCANATQNEVGSYSVAMGVCEQSLGLKYESGDKSKATANSGDGGDCETAFKRAVYVCDDAKGGMVFQVIGAFSQGQQPTNIQEACSIAQTVSTVTGGAASAFASSCGTAAKLCLNTCGNEEIADANSRSADCSRYIQKASMATASAVSSFVAAYNAKRCKDQAGKDCSDPKNYNDSEHCLQQYCMVPGRQNDPKCDDLAQMCNDPAKAQSSSFCVCYQNPNYPQCRPGGTPLTPPGGSLVDTAANKNSLLDGLFGPDDPLPYEGNGDFGGGNSGVQGANQPTNAAAPGGGGGDSRGYPGESGGAAGTNLDTNILGGARGGAGGGYPLFGNNNAGSGGGGARGGSGTGADSKTFNLRDFLPGGKKDGRAIANATYLQQGITAAEGLTNFQKVTRKITEKRGTLMP